MPFGKLNVLLITPTVVAAMNIEGTMLHSVLTIFQGYFGKNWPPLTDKGFKSLKVIIISDIFMILNYLFFNVHLRLN